MTVGPVVPFASCWRSFIRAKRCSSNFFFCCSSNSSFNSRLSLAASFLYFCRSFGLSSLQMGPTFFITSPRFNFSFVLDFISSSMLRKKTLYAVIVLALFFFFLGVRTVDLTPWCFLSTGARPPMITAFLISWVARTSSSRKLILFMLGLSLVPSTKYRRLQTRAVGTLSGVYRFCCTSLIRQTNNSTIHFHASCISCHASHHVQHSTKEERTKVSKRPGLCACTCILVLYRSIER